MRSMAAVRRSKLRVSRRRRMKSSAKRIRRRAPLRAEFCGFSWKFVDALHRILPRGKLLQDILDALVFLARHQRLFNCCKVDRRAVIMADIAQLVAGQNVDQQVALLEPDRNQIPRAIASARSAAAARGSPGAAGSNRRRAFSGWFK
jgi:hypothetical protein